jgi:hypothetical protein
MKSGWCRQLQLEKQNYQGFDMEEELPRLKPDIGCEVLGMSVDFVAKSGMLFMPNYQCPDMRRTIDLFKKICPEIQLIETMAGVTEDTKYVLLEGKWIAGDAVRTNRQGKL